MKLDLYWNKMHGELAIHSNIAICRSKKKMNIAAPPSGYQGKTHIKSVFFSGRTTKVWVPPPQTLSNSTLKFNLKIKKFSQI